MKKKQRNDLALAWDALAALRRNDLDGALAWHRRWAEVMALDDGLGSALLRLFDDPAPLLAALP